MCSLDILVPSYPPGRLKTTPTAPLPRLVSRELHCSPPSCSSQNLEVIRDHCLYFRIHLRAMSQFPPRLPPYTLVNPKITRYLSSNHYNFFLHFCSLLSDLLGLLLLSLLPLLETESGHALLRPFTSISFLLSTRYIRAVQITIPQDQQWLPFSLAVHCLPWP